LTQDAGLALDDIAGIIGAVTIRGWTAIEPPSGA
jgi:hypothetical protein